MTRDDQKRYLILKDSNIYKGLIILAIPLMLNNFLKTFHDIIDMFFVGRIEGAGVDAVAAIQLTFPVVFTFLSLGMGLSVAGTALISQFVGSQQLEDAKRYATQLIVLSLILGVLLMVLSYLASPMIIQAMGVDPSLSIEDRFVFENSVQYLRIRAFELPLLFVFFAFMAIRQASGDTVTPVIISGSAIILNIILSPILISVFNLGVPGAAYATLIANAIVMPMAFYYLFFSVDGITINLKYGMLESYVVKDILKTAIPASLGQAITAVGFGVMNGIIYGFGRNTVAAFGVGNRILSIILHPVMAVGAVMSAYIGQNIGALNPARAKLAFKKAMILSVGVMSVGSLLIMFVRRPLAGLFIVDNLEALNLASEYMFYILLGLPLMAMFQAFVGTYNGTGKTQYTFWLSVTRLWCLRIPLVIYMRDYTNLGNSGIWYSMLISNFIIVIVGYILYLRLDFKPKIRLEEPLKTVELKTT